MDTALTRKAVCAILLIFGGLTLSNTGSAEKTKKSPKLYYLYGDAKPGTKFKAKIATSRVPFNKRYKNMSSALQARVKASYGGLADSETPPFPRWGNKAIYRPLLKAHRSLLREGKLTVVAIIKADGSVGKISVYNAPNSNVATMVNHIIANTEFDPGTCAGTPCPMEYLFETGLSVSPSSTH